MACQLFLLPVVALLKYSSIITMSETRDLCISQPFDGNLRALPRLRLFPQRYIPAQFLRCNGGRLVFLASIPNEICGGHIEHGLPIPELLCIFLLTEQGDVYTQELHMRDTFVPARFFWMARTGAHSLREAPLTYRGDEMCSLAVNAYNYHGEPRHLTVHRLLAWTFLCTPALYTSRWSPDVHCEHDDDNHGNNELSNLRLWIGSGVDGHAAASARKRRR